MNNLIKLGPLVAVEINKVIAVVPSGFGLRVTFENGTQIKLEKDQLTQTVAETFDILLKVEKIGFSQGGYTRPSAQPISGVVQPVLDINAVIDEVRNNEIRQQFDTDLNVGNENIDSKPLLSPLEPLVLDGANPIAMQAKLQQAGENGFFSGDQIQHAKAKFSAGDLNQTDYELAHFDQEGGSKLKYVPLNIIIKVKHSPGGPKKLEMKMHDCLYEAFKIISEFKE